jgi:hypothetical protein
MVPDPMGSGGPESRGRYFFGRFYRPRSLLSVAVIATEVTRPGAGVTLVAVPAG